MARQSTDARVPVLLTRPEAQSRGFAKALVARFADRVRPVIAPLMAVQQVAPDLPVGAFGAVIFTSANGVEASLPLRDRLPELAFCVGARTAERARAAGFQARSADGDAEALVQLALMAHVDGAMLHLHGSETRGDVVGRLQAAGLNAEGRTVYRQVPQPLTEEARELLLRPGVLIVPLFSPRTALLFATAMPDRVQADCRIVAISATVAEAIALPAVVAARPDAEAMLQGVEAVLCAVPPP